jgi:hypothetical protein
VRAAAVLLLLAVGCTSSAPRPKNQPEDDGGEEDPAPRPRPTGSDLAIEAEMGALDEDEVAKVQAAVRPQVTACFKRANAGLRFAVVGGEIDIRLRVKSDGAIRWLHPVRDTFGNHATAKCIMDALEAQTWPRPVGGEEGQADAHYEIDPAARRPAVEWSEGDLGAAGSTLKQKLAACRGDAGTSELSVTLYIDPEGEVISAGGAAGDEMGLSAIDCGIAAARAITFPSPGSYPAKVVVSAR